VSSREKASTEETIKATFLFQEQSRKVILHFDPSLVIHTDQMGCEYSVQIRQTLSYQGEKATKECVSQLNKMIHFYTAQYSVTLTGELLPTVFIFLQDISGKFGPRVKFEVEEAMDQYKTVFVTCTKSGKLLTSTVALYLEKVLKPHVREEKFLLFIDSWSEQTNQVPL
jgi:hypothetical protein